MKGTCFIICPIGDAGTEIRDAADLLFEFVISPVLGRGGAGLELERADKLAEPGIITNQIIERLINADLVVADLSLSNPNVFYELAIRHVTAKPCVHMIQRGDRLPFDNASARAIQFDLGDLRSVAAAKEELALQSDHALKAGRSESPVTISTSVDALRQTGDETKIALGNIIETLGGLQSDMELLRREMKSSQAGGALGAFFTGTPTGARIDYTSDSQADLQSPITSGLLAALRGEARKPEISTADVAKALKKDTRDR